MLLRGILLTEQFRRVLSKRHKTGTIDLASDPIGSHGLIPRDLFRRQHLAILVLLERTAHHRSLSGGILHVRRHAQEQTGLVVVLDLQVLHPLHHHLQLV